MLGQPLAVQGRTLGYSSQQGYSDSRFFFTGALEITEENKKELRGYTDQETSAQVIPDELITAFEKEAVFRALPALTRFSVR